MNKASTFLLFLGAFSFLALAACVAVLCLAAEVLRKLFEDPDDTRPLYWRVSDL